MTDRSTFTRAAATGNLQSLVTNYNANLDVLEQELENTLSRKDNVLPNSMEDVLDMNGYGIINVGEIETPALIVNGVPVEPSQGVTADWAFQSYTFTATASQTSFSVAPYTPHTTSVLVEVNGLALPPADISVSGTNVIIPACTAGDEVVIRRYTKEPSPFPAADDITFNQAGTVTTRTVQNKLRDVVSVKDFGAVGDGVADDTAAIQAAIDSLDTNTDTVTGGVIYFPRGRYMVSATINVKTNHVDGLASIKLVGDGLHNTVIQAKSGFSGTNLILIDGQTYCGLEKLHLLGGLTGPYNVANGVRINNGSHHTIDQVFAQNFTSNCFLFSNNFMLSMRGCRAKGGATGFNFTGFHTSINVVNCYAVSNTFAGYFIEDAVYSVFSSCAADFGSWGYVVTNTSGVELVGCGAEACNYAGFYIVANAANDAACTIKGTRATLSQCFATACDALLAGYGSVYTEQGDTSTIDVLVDRFCEFNVAGSVSVASNAVTSKHSLELRNCEFTGTTYGVGLTPRESAVTKKNGVSVTASNTPVCDLKSVFGDATQYSGVLHIWAGNGAAQNSALFNGAAYVLLVTKSTGGSGVVEIASNGLVSGAGANFPSFTWTLDTTTNQLLATPIGSTSGTFYFHITQLGALGAF